MENSKKKKTNHGKTRKQYGGAVTNELVKKTVDYFVKVKNRMDKKYPNANNTAGRTVEESFKIAYWLAIEILKWKYDLIKKEPVIRKNVDFEDLKKINKYIRSIFLLWHEDKNKSIEGGVEGDLNVARGLISAIYQNARDVFDHNEHINTGEILWNDPSVLGDIKFPEDFLKGLQSLLKIYPEFDVPVQETRPAAPSAAAPAPTRQTDPSAPRRTQKRRRSITPEQERRRQRTEEPSSNFVDSLYQKILHFFKKKDETALTTVEEEKLYSLIERQYKKEEEQKKEEENPYKKKFENWDEDVRKMYEEEERKRRKLLDERNRISENILRNWGFTTRNLKEYEFKKRQREELEAKEAKNKKAPPLNRQPEWIKMTGNMR